MVTTQIGRAKTKTRKELLEPKIIQTNFDGPILTLRYNPTMSSKVHGIIKNLQIILDSNEELKAVFGETPRVVYRRAKNLKDILVRATLPKTENGNEAIGSKSCNKPRCQTCKNVQNSKCFQNHDNSKEFQIKSGPNDCSTSNVVYLINCKSCKIQYVGSSKGQFRTRFNNYKSHHRNYCKRDKNGTLEKGNSVPQQLFHKHFLQEGHNGISDMIFTLIDKADNNAEVLKRESFWQFKLNTFEPHGLNVRNVPHGQYA